jgi:hypothetical protein
MEYSLSEQRYAKISNNPFHGTVRLQVLGIKWKGGEVSTTIQKLKRMAGGIERTYKKNSRGLLKVKTRTAIVSVPYNKNYRNLKKAEQFAMNKHSGFKYYAIVNGAVKRMSSAANGVAHLRGTLLNTANHEVGHLFGLGHSGKYEDNGKFNEYGDRSSFMGNMGSSFITAPQYHYLGWLKREEVARHSEPFGKYTLRSVTDFGRTGELASVMIPMEGRRSAFVSVIDWLSKKDKKLGKKSKKCIVLHLQANGSSRKVAMFGNKYEDKKYTGVVIEKVSELNGLITLTIGSLIGARSR